MVLKRKAGIRKGGAKRRRVMRRKPRIPRSIVPSKVMVKRTRYQETWSFGTTTTNDFWRYYQWNSFNFNNFSEFGNVFDEYKLCALKYTFRPAYDTVDVSTTSGPSPTSAEAYAHFFVDPSSTVIPTGVYSASTLNTFLENDRVKTRSLTRPFSIYFRPKMSDTLFGGSTTSRAISSTYVKTANTGVDFRGFHIYLQQNNFSTANTAIKLDVFITAYMMFRNLK